MRFHQDFGVDQVPYQVEVRYFDCVAPFSFCVYLRTIRFSFPRETCLIIPCISSFQCGISSLGNISGVHSIQVGYAVASTVISFLSLSLSISLTAFLGTSRTQSITRRYESLKSRQSFFRKANRERGGGKGIYSDYIQKNRSKEIDDHSRFNLSDVKTLTK